jgi:hypothetical protein
MRVALVIICISVCAFAQEKTRFGQPTVPPASVTAACGNLGVSMAVKLDDSQHAIAQPEPGVAHIYFIEDGGGVRWIGYPLVRVGIGGRWVGALKRDSYLSVSVDPGEQHLCAATGDGHIALAHVVVEAGKTYYYRIRISSDSAVVEYLSLNPVDSDEAAFQIGMFPVAIAHLKK